MHLYVSHPDDQLGLRALACLKELGGHTEIVRSPGIQNTDGLSAFFTSPGQYPSKHVRKLRLPQDVETRGFTIPLWTPDACTLYALRGIVQPTKAQLKNFEEAMRHLYYVDAASGTWKGPKKRRPSRHRSSEDRSYML